MAVEALQRFSFRNITQCLTDKAAAVAINYALSAQSKLVLEFR